MKNIIIYEYLDGKHTHDSSRKLCNRVIPTNMGTQMIGLVCYFEFESDENYTYITYALIDFKAIKNVI